MKKVTSAAFRRTYANETEPVEVTAYGKPVGYWYPLGSDLPGAKPRVARLPVDPETDGSRPHLRAGTKPRVMVGTPTRIIDPLDVARQQRQQWTRMSLRIGQRTGETGARGRTEAD